MMDEIVRTGKIANYGLSVEKVSEAMDAIQFSNVKSIQIIFNIFRQKPAETFFKEAAKKNVAIIARVPLASGLLTGKMRETRHFQRMITETTILMEKHLMSVRHFLELNLKKDLRLLKS